MQKTLAAVYNEDLIGGTIEGKRWGTINMLGFQINANEFLSDAIRWNFHLPETTLEDMKKIKIPFCLIAGANDPWVNHNEIKSLLNLAEGNMGEFILMNDAIHQLYENPSTVKEILKQIVMRVQKSFELSGNALPQLREPNFREIALQSRLEKERLRVSSPTSNTTEDEGFWSGYLERFHFIIRIPEYRRFYEKLSTLLGPLQPGDEILDAGCGNGSFGVWLLTNNFQEKDQSPLRQFPFRFTYTGADLVPSALVSAQSTHSQILKNIPVNSNKDRPVYNYNISDLNKPMPYLNGYFDKICCNLVISYLTNPRWVLGELVRILKPGGHLVASSLKPSPDLSLIYSSFIEEANSKDELEEARRLLNNASSILEKERHGQFKFLGENELSSMARELEVSNFSIERSFGNQANVIKIVK
ncbi:MAG: class I SAM-dependent methyltransferase [Elusimicrobia bacterium]|nr:class I SAM-dependent methyltransferase [Elusimicrobiota bacterium]